MAIGEISAARVNSAIRRVRESGAEERAELVSQREANNVSRTALAAASISEMPAADERGLRGWVERARRKYLSNLRIDDGSMSASQLPCLSIPLSLSLSLCVSIPDVSTPRRPGCVSVSVPFTYVTS